MFTRTSYQSGSLNKEKRQRGPAVWTFRWRESGPDGERVKRKIIIGTVEKYRSETHARKALAALDLKIIHERRDAIHPALITVGQLIDHYKKQELSDKRSTKAESTCEVYRFYIDKWLIPAWQDQRVQAVKTVAVEDWLRSLPLADGSKSKLRNIFSAIFNHGIRHELTSSNPITGSVRGAGVRQSAKRRRDPDVLTAEEIKAILKHLSLRDRVLVLLASSTGLRFSELRGLKWGDINEKTRSINVVRGVVGKHISHLKTAASRKPVPCHPTLMDALNSLRQESAYNQHDDWVFASDSTKGKIPVWPSSLLADHIAPAVREAGIKKHVSWHVFRHSYATSLKANGADPKVVQESLRHASSRITMDTYTQAVPEHIREAHGKVVESITATLPLQQLAEAV